MMFAVIKRLILIISVGFLGACESPGGIDGETYSLATIKKAVIVSLPLGLRKKSINGREHFSHYFRRKNPSSRKSDRAYALVKVLGDRRPYRVVVDVYVERKDSGEWTFVGKDLRLSKRITKKISQNLSSSRSDRNVIDDFRAF